MKCGKEPIGSGRKAVELRFVSLDSQDSLVSSCLPESLCSTTRQSKAQDKSRPAFFLCLPLDPRQQQAAAAAEPGCFPSRHFMNLLLRWNHSLIPLSPPSGLSRLIPTFVHVQHAPPRNYPALTSTHSAGDCGITAGPLSLCIQQKKKICNPPICCSSSYW